MFSIQELRSSTIKELLQELQKARKEALKIHINVKTKHEKDGSKSKKSKHYIARILTMIKEIRAEDCKKKITKDSNGLLKKEVKIENKTIEDSEKK